MNLLTYTGLVWVLSGFMYLCAPNDGLVRFVYGFMVLYMPFLFYVTNGFWQR